MQDAWDCDGIVRFGELPSGDYVLELTVGIAGAGPAIVRNVPLRLQ